MVVILVIAFFLPAAAQDSFLKRKIDIHATNIKLKDVLVMIGDEAGCRISYNSAGICGDSIVSVKVSGQPVNRVLDGIFGGTVRYTIIGNHIVLTSKVKTADSQGKKDYVISGYITDRRTNKKILSVTVFDIDGKTTTVTNGEGFYEICLPADRDARNLSFCRDGYLDTVIIVRPSENASVSLSLMPEHEPLPVLSYKDPVPLSPGITEKPIVNFFVSSEVMINSKNLNMYEIRPAQISFIPYLGSNAKLGGAIVNNVSLNVLAGYSDGVKGVEVAGLVNIEKSFMNGFQLAGFANIVGREVNGVQIAGFWNHVSDTLTGVQISGFNNVLRGKMKGVQISGFSNFTSCNVDGVQISGFTNITSLDVNLIQIAGFYNSCSESGGFQAAGFSNMVKIENRGVQLAGAFNYTKVNRGMQIAAFNYCDSATGVSLGLFSWAGNGYRELGFSVNEMMFADVSFKCGTRHLYNIYSVGYGFAGLQDVAWGLGLGYTGRIGKKNSWCIDWVAHTVMNNFSFRQYSYSLNSLSAAFSLTGNSRFVISAGPAIRLKISATEEADVASFPAEESLVFFESVPGNVRLKGWAGGQISMGYRFAY
ncbi:MAG: STN and carboxypeptidase regulatory-like domain-containing protein [Bacteroidota bacterium]